MYRFIRVVSSGSPKKKLKENDETIIAKNAKNQYRASVNSELIRQLTNSVPVESINSPPCTANIVDMSIFKSLQNKIRNVTHVSPLIAKRSYFFLIYKSKVERLKE